MKVTLYEMGERQKATSGNVTRNKAFVNPEAFGEVEVKDSLMNAGTSTVLSGLKGIVMGRPTAQGRIDIHLLVYGLSVKAFQSVVSATGDRSVRAIKHALTNWSASKSEYEVLRMPGEGQSFTTPADERTGSQSQVAVVEAAFYTDREIVDHMCDALNIVVFGYLSLLKESGVEVHEPEVASVVEEDVDERDPVAV